MSGLPEYTYEPIFTPSSDICAAPKYKETRARLKIGGSFFRSKELGEKGNYIKIEALIDINFLYIFNVYFKDQLVETFNISLGINYYQYQYTYSPAPPQANVFNLTEQLPQVSTLNETTKLFPADQIQNFGPPNIYGDFQTVTSSNEYNKLRELINNEISGSKYIEMPPRGYDVNDNDSDTTLLQPFTISALLGGEGPPIDDTSILAFRTGPTRTIAILTSTESITGEEIKPTQERNIIQWDGTSWIAYIPYSN